ncbi:MAG TPA: hypothetical protein VJ672_09940 [Gemmatimonadaceae bacterium]|nr:hypothetical protein [Gemmatimonadaceae bacterium]
MHRLSIGVMVALAMSAQPAFAQAVATVEITRKAVGKAQPAQCVVKAAPYGAESIQAPDILRVRIVPDSAIAINAQPTLHVLLDGDSVFSIVDDSVGSRSFGRGHLTGRVVALKAQNTVEPLCIVIPYPSPITTLVISGDRTSFVADGAVAAGLKSGKAASQITGSLGILHDSDKEGERRRRALCAPSWFKPPNRADSAKAVREALQKLGSVREFTPTSAESALVKTEALSRVRGKFRGWGALKVVPVQFLALFNSLCMDPLAGERLKSVVTLVSSLDSVRSTDPLDFTQAVLVPSLAAGQRGSGLIDYYAFEKRGSSGSGTQGVRVNLNVLRLRWQIPTHSDTLPREVFLIGLDLRRRWSFVDHSADDRGNTFAFTVELGPAVRFIRATGRDSRDRREFMEKAIGTDHKFDGGIAGSFSIRLRQVTASVEVPYLYQQRRNFQPVIGMRFDAPFFTL